MKQKSIHLVSVIGRMWKYKWVYVGVCTVVFVLSCLYIVCIPRYYDARVRLAPEETGGEGVSSLASLAENFGLSLGGTMSSDAISPELYPELFTSNDFIVSLFNIPVKTLDGSVSTTYYDYIMNHQKFAPWDPFVNKVRSMLKPSEEEVTPEAEAQASAGKGGQPAMPNAWRLTRRQEELVKAVKESITCGIDKKTGILTIHITDQDPLVCATMADSVRLRLQNFITDYRTGKARIDVEYYEKLVEQSKETYDKAFARYAAFADSHQNAVLASVSSQESELENEMDKAYSTYTAFRTQLESAQAKVQERTPAFHVLEPPSVPAKPAGPKRMIFVAFMTLLAALGTTIWLYRKEISSLLHGEE